MAGGPGATLSRSSAFFAFPCYLPSPQPGFTCFTRCVAGTRMAAPELWNLLTMFQRTGEGNSIRNPRHTVRREDGGPEVCPQPQQLWSERAGRVLQSDQAAGPTPVPGRGAVLGEMLTS